MHNNVYILGVFDYESHGFDELKTIYFHIPSPLWGNRTQRQTCLIYAKVPPVLQELKKTVTSFKNTMRHVNSDSIF